MIWPLRPRRGRVYTGHRAYFGPDYESGIPRPGWYALRADGKRPRRPLVRLVRQELPDGGERFLIARRRDPIQQPGARLVELEATVEGKAALAVDAGAASPVDDVDDWDEADR